MRPDLAEAWYRNSGFLQLLRPFSWLYALLTGFRRMAYRLAWLKSTRFPVPVIVVGNITVGGTGKTPLTLYLVRLLQGEGFRPAVVSRGYGGKADYPLRVTSATRPEASGDEPLLICRETGVPVVVDPNRPQAVDYLLAHNLCDIVISDDGLQHYALGRDLELVVVDGKRLFGNGMQLPAGPLREPLTRLKRADAVIVNGSAHEMASLKGVIPDPVPRFRFTLASAGLMPVGVASPESPPASPDTVHAVAGIGNPERFFTTLENSGFRVIRHPFPDHHRFVPSDLAFDDGLPVVMTSKDAVKCRDFAGAQVWQLPVTARPDQEFVEFMQAFLGRCREKNAHAG